LYRNFQWVGRLQPPIRLAMSFVRPGYVPRILVMTRHLSGPMLRCDQLTDAGWRIIKTDIIAEALSAIKADMVDMVMFDLPFLAELNMDFHAVLRELLPVSHLPVVIIAGRLSEEARAGLLNDGAADVITDDEQAAEFTARVNAHLRIKELADQLVLSMAALKRSLRREGRLLAKLRRDKANLETLVTIDPLTRAQNVRSFREILDHEFKMSIRYNQPLSMLMLDLDYFKLVNDTYGHPAGDYVLKELAVILQQSVRQSDVVARTGGEEFGILLPKAGPKEAAKFADRVRKEVCTRKFSVYGKDMHVTVSIGWASYPTDVEITDQEMLIYLADQSLLIAKETGRDRVVAYCQLETAIRRRLVRQHQSLSAITEETELAVEEY
jgi:diguanylate cyclase (GGDEF)-like protein